MSFRKLSSVWLGAAMFALLAPSMAMAQTGRLDGMGLMSDYVRDPSGTFSYPSQVNHVGNYIYGELGNVLFNPNTGSPVTLDRQMGAVLGNLWDGRFGTWGVFLREETPALGQGSAFTQPNPGFLGGDPNQNTQESFDLIWGQMFGTTSLGVRVHRSFTSFEQELPGVTTTLEFDPSTFNSENLSRNIFGFGGGIGFELNPDTDLEIGGLFQSRTYEIVAGGTPVEEEDGPTTYQVAARLLMEAQPNLMIVPVVKFYSFDLSRTDNIATETYDNSMTGWAAGVAGNWTLGANDLFVLGATFAQNKIQQEEDLFGISSGLGMGDELDVTETILPQVFMALETNVNPWLTLRMGANKGVFSTIEAEDAPNSETQTFTQSPFSMNIGAGVKLGTLQLDAVLNNVFPHTLGWLGSGIPQVYFPKVTATYAF